MGEGSAVEFASPWEQPEIKMIVGIFNGSVTKITPLNQTSAKVSNDDSDWSDR